MNAALSVLFLLPGVGSLAGLSIKCAIKLGGNLVIPCRCHGFMRAESHWHILGDRMTKELVINALEDAINHFCDVMPVFFALTVEVSTALMITVKRQRQPALS